MEVAMLKSPNGALVPMDDAEADKMRKWRPGTVVRGEFAEMRNGAFFRKYWTLLKLAFEMWESDMPEQLYQGVKVKPEFERFRKDVTIMAGYFTPVFGADGSVRLEAESLKWSRMDEDRFEKLYSATINVILEKVLASRKLDARQLNDAVNRVMAYA